MAPASSAAKAPTGRLVGYTDLNAYNQFADVDPTEHLGDLLFPQSVLTYSQMRRDPQLAAVLAGISLPIRRATWAIDPTGCDPVVAKRVADDMGLSLVGEDDPGPARLRGMSWPEHLRTALLSLVYGFYGYELLADVSSGQARLVNAYQRTPSTIVFIHSLPNGDFGGISQLYHPDTLEQAEIGPERMVWYALDVEGSAHHGNSILRPGYSSWLIKQELRRVLATSNRRWGTGVSTVRALPGTSPTPEQMAAAAQMAQAARAGDTAGGAVPPGFVMEILGMQGSAPNTIEALRWVDQQMSGMVLSRWMDLGSSQTGSRALGEAFIDTFLLSIQSLADHMADTATRQIAARLVAWNEGVDQPVPRVTVADVGSRHEVTADALNALMQSGALSADPQLEEWVRRTYRLPPRDPDVPWVRMVPASRGTPHPADTQQPVAASTGRPRARRRQPATGQLALPIAAADDTEPDPAAEQKDAAQHRHAWEQTRAQVLADWPDVAQPMVDDLAQQAADASASGDLSELATIAVSAAVLAGLVAALTPPLLALAAESAGHVLADAKAHGVTVRKPKAPGAGKAGQVAEVTASLIATGYAQAATRKAMQVAGGTAEDVRVAVESTLTDMGNSAAGLVADQVGAGLTAAQAAGRSAAFAAAGKKIAGWRASETLDSNTCEPCREISQTVFATLAEVEAAYGGAGGYSGCLGGLRCRGFARAIWK
jgi:hypothetical protein